MLIYGMAQPADVRRAGMDVMKMRSLRRTLYVLAALIVTGVAF
jgi:hypothetical protein